MCVVGEREREGELVECVRGVAVFAGIVVGGVLWWSRVFVFVLLLLLSLPW